MVEFEVRKIRPDLGKLIRSSGSKEEADERIRRVLHHNITGRWYRVHRIYREIQNEIAGTLRTNGVTPAPLPLNHVAYCNYFLRPAPVSGGRMEGNARQQDLEVAEEVLT